MPHVPPPPPLPPLPLGGGVCVRGLQPEARHRCLPHPQPLPENGGAWGDPAPPHAARCTHTHTHTRRPTFAPIRTPPPPFAGRPARPQVERCWLCTRNGTTIELQPCVDETPAPYPTVQPMASDRQITTRTTAGAKSKASQEVSVVFNLCNEPWLKYTISAIADKTMKPSGWTSARLRDDVLFLESNRWGRGWRVGVGWGVERVRVRARACVGGRRVGVGVSAVRRKGQIFGGGGRGRRVSFGWPQS